MSQLTIADASLATLVVLDSARGGSDPLLLPFLTGIAILTGGGFQGAFIDDTPVGLCRIDDQVL